MTEYEKPRILSVTAQHVAELERENAKLRELVQAIEATLGRGTCKDVGRYCFSCSECGWVANEPHHVLGGFWPNYCPNCGRKVVED